MIKIFSTIFCILILSSCVVKKTKDISYLKDTNAEFNNATALNIYQPAKSKNNPVLIFIHGGTWQSGNKDTYGIIGHNFAKRGIVAVIANYTLSPNGNYDTMAKEVTAVTQWAHENIADYNGDPSQLFLMGHSAGGHLIALAGISPKYLGETDLIKGLILNDAAGLDMYSYLNVNPPTKKSNYNVTWTLDPKNWKEASPIYSLSEKAPPFLIYVGTKTYPSILSSNKDFIKKLNEFQPNVKINYLKKKHVPMMRQFLFPLNKHYKEISKFIDMHK